jgi:hypothetical protein
VYRGSEVRKLPLTGLECRRKRRGGMGGGGDCGVMGDTMFIVRAIECATENLK